MAACRPLEQSMEPPVLFAVRCGCSLEVLAALLKGGASPDSVDTAHPAPLLAIARHSEEQTHQSPLRRMGRQAQMFRPFARQLSEAQCCEYASWLLACGADPAVRDEAGVTALEYAERAEQWNFARLLRHWGGVQANALRETWSLATVGDTAGSPGQRGGCALRCLPQVVCERICDMLAPVPQGARGP